MAEFVLHPEPRQHRRYRSCKPNTSNVCPTCGQRMKTRNHLITQLASMTGVDPATMKTMSMGALEGLIDAWPKREFQG